MIALSDHVDALLGMVGVIGVAMIGGMVKLILDQRAGKRAAMADRDAHARRLAAVEAQMQAVVTATTVNHHASDPPTLVDRLDTVQASVRDVTVMVARVDTRLDDAIRTNDEQTRAINAIFKTVQRLHPNEKL